MKTSVARFVLTALVCIASLKSFTAELPATAPLPPTAPVPGTAPASPPSALPQKAPSTAPQELQALKSKIEAKLTPGPKTEKDFADELKEFDTLLARHKGEKSDEVAQILFLKGMFYVQILDDAEKGISFFKQIKVDFPGTRFAEGVDGVIANIEQMEAIKKVQRSLVIGAKFPDFDEKDIYGRPMSTLTYKGKIVLVDFWATWCGPCLMELPYVLATYQKHHTNGFEILGISFDQDRQTLTEFTRAQNMPWQQFFDVGASNRLALKYGAITIPTTYLLDREGKIIGSGLRGEQLEAAVAAALGKK